MPPPASYLNISATPFTQVVTQAMFNVANVQWFKYVAASQIVLGLQVTQGGTFVPQTFIYAADGTTQVGLSPEGPAGRWEMLSTAGDYYVKVVRFPSGPSDVDFTVTADTRPLWGSTAVDELLVNDDSERTPEPYPAVVLTSTGAVSFYVPGIPAGETGAILPSNVSIWHDFYGNYSETNRIAVFDAQLAYIGSVACGLTGFDPPIFAPDVAHAQFYVVNYTGGLWTISSAGVATNTGYSFPSGALVIPVVIAVNADGTVLYWATSRSGVLHALNLSTFTALPDVGTIPGFAPGTDWMALTTFGHRGDLFVMPDGTVVTWYKTTAGTYHLVVVSSAGTVLHDYAYAPPVSIDHLAYIAYDSAHIWVWWFQDADENTARFGRLTLATGVIDQDFTTQAFASGVNQGGTSPFGPSASCTFVLIHTPTTVVPPPGTPTEPPGGGPTPPDVAPSYHLDARYIRRLRRAPHVTNENKRVFYRSFELDLERGEGLATGQGADPMVLLRISRDGGQTWGEESRLAAGALGDYTARVIARRLGQARDTVFEVVVSDPIAWSLVGAWLDLEPGTN